jgi:hypothetical protein
MSSGKIRHIFSFLLQSNPLWRNRSGASARRKKRKIKSASRPLLSVAQAEKTASKIKTGKIASHDAATAQRKIKFKIENPVFMVLISSRRCVVA